MVVVPEVEVPLSEPMAGRLVALMPAFEMMLASSRTRSFESLPFQVTRKFTRANRCSFRPCPLERTVAVPALLRSIDRGVQAAASGKAVTVSRSKYSGNTCADFGV